MKKLFIILLLAIGCSESDEPTPQLCAEYTKLVTDLERDITAYKSSGGTDWKVLADMRTELAKRKENRNKNCN